MPILSFYRRDQLTPITVDTDTDAGERMAADLEGAGYYQDEERAIRESQSLVGGLNYTAPAGETPTVEEEEPVNLSPNQVYLRLPWLKAFAGSNADKLVDAYIKGYIEGDASETAATAAMREIPEYNTVFPGIVNAET